MNRAIIIVAAIILVSIAGIAVSIVYGQSAKARMEAERAVSEHHRQQAEMALHEAEAGNDMPGEGGGSAQLEKRFSDLQQRMGDLQAALVSVREEFAEGIEMLDERLDKVDETSKTRVLRLRDEMKVKMGALEKLARAGEPELPIDLNALSSELEKQGVRLNVEDSRVEVDAIILQTNVLVEFVAVTKRGKTHEALFLLSCEPRALNAGLLALGLSPGTPYEVKEEADVPEELRSSIESFEVEDFETGETQTLYYFPPEGDGVIVTVSWMTEAGERVEHRIERLIIDNDKGAPLDPHEWIYLGSRFEVHPDTGEEVYVADYTGDLISIWHSYKGNTILDNPLLAGRSDEIFYPDSKTLPPAESKVTLWFEKAEKNEIPDAVPAEEKEKGE